MQERSLTQSPTPLLQPQELSQPLDLAHLSHQALDLLAQHLALPQELLLDLPQLAPTLPLFQHLSAGDRLSPNRRHISLDHAFMQRRSALALDIFSFMSILTAAF